MKIDGRWSIGVGISVMETLLNISSKKEGCLISNKFLE